LCLFDFNMSDLAAAVTVKRKQDSKLQYKTLQQLLDELPLSTWKRNVRRTYVSPEVQVQRLQQWFETYVAVGSTKAVDMQGMHLVAGGDEGLRKFQQTFHNQLALSRDGYLSGD
jgi:hypothetical protein